MWDDPLFNPGAAEEFIELAQDDPQWGRKQRREMALHTMDVLYDRIEEETARFWWLWNRTQQYLPPEVAIELITVIRDGRSIDPEFTFRKELEHLEASNAS